MILILGGSIMVIYHIKNTIDGKRYVGQTIQKNPKKRWWYHRHQLRNGIHMSPYLQNAWHKYGENSFVFEIVARAGSLSKLNELETQQIAKWKKEKLCYNITNGGDNVIMTAESRSKLSKSLTEYYCKHGKVWSKLQSPSGIIYEGIRNLTNFCRQHNLRRDRVKALFRGEIGQHRGWSAGDLTFKRNKKKTQGAKNWQITTPAGKTIEVTNLKLFCEKNGLDYEAMKFQHYSYNRSKKYQDWNIRSK